MAQNGTTTYLGVTPPISIDPPTERHKQITETLITELKAMGTYESPAESRQREIVLSKLNAIVKDFVYQVSLMRHFPESQAKEAGGKIFTFGSYRLGVHGPGADIDTLAIVPRHVVRDDFFTILEPMLKARPEVTECTGVPEAFVPIITFKFSGVAIDLLFASIPTMAAIPEDLNIQDNNLLRGLDEESVRSLNGSRVTDNILRLVPNVLVFRDALRTIKLWAKRRAIYSNVMGFLGGVVWAMLVARICQLYPNECAGGIISKFFVILHHWDWPTPIMLKPIEDGPLGLRVWNPLVHRPDQAHKMPVITPAYPAQNSTHNVTQSTRIILMKEFKRAADIVDKVVVRSADWSELFQKHDFFSSYRYYLQITASSIDSEVQLKWSGTVESKIRHLVTPLEVIDTLSLAHPFVDGFDRVNYCETTEESHVCMSGHLPPEIYKRKEEDYANRPDVLKVYTTSFFVGLLVEKKDPNSTERRQLDIAYPTAEFTRRVKDWPRFEEDKMAIVVRYVKAADLPPYAKPPPQPKNGKPKSLKRPKTERAVSETTQAALDTTTIGSPAKRLRADSSALVDGVSTPAPAVSTPGGTHTPNASIGGLSTAPKVDTPRTESATRALQALSTSNGVTPAVVAATGSLPGSVSLPTADNLAEAVVEQHRQHDIQEAKSLELPINGTSAPPTSAIPAT